MTQERSTEREREPRTRNQPDIQHRFSFLFTSKRASDVHVLGLPCHAHGRSGPSVTKMHLNAHSSRVPCDGEPEEHPCRAWFCSCTHPMDATSQTCPASSAPARTCCSKPSMTSQSRQHAPALLYHDSSKQQHLESVSRRTNRLKVLKNKTLGLPSGTKTRSMALYIQKHCHSLGFNASSRRQSQHSAPSKPPPPPLSPHQG